MRKCITHSYRESCSTTTGGIIGDVILVGWLHGTLQHAAPAPQCGSSSPGGDAFDFTVRAQFDSCRCVGKGDLQPQGDSEVEGRRYCTRAIEVFQVFPAGDCRIQGWNIITSAVQCARAARFLSWNCTNDCNGTTADLTRPPGCYGTQELGLEVNRVDPDLVGGINESFSQVCYRNAKEKFKFFDSGSCVVDGWSLIQSPEQCARAADVLGSYCAQQEPNSARCVDIGSSSMASAAGCFGTIEDGFTFNRQTSDDTGTQGGLGYACVKATESEDFHFAEACAVGQVPNGSSFIFERSLRPEDCGIACTAAGGVAYDLRPGSDSSDSCRCVGVDNAQSPSDDDAGRLYCAPTPPVSTSCVPGTRQGAASLFTTGWKGEEACAASCWAAGGSSARAGLVGFEVDSNETADSCVCIYTGNQPVVSSSSPSRRSCTYDVPALLALAETGSRQVEEKPRLPLVEPTSLRQASILGNSFNASEVLRVCAAGEAQPEAVFLFQRDLNEEVACAMACFAIGGVAFDYTLTSKSDSCRCVSADGAAGPQSQGDDGRFFCARPVSFSCQEAGQLPQETYSIILTDSFTNLDACAAFCSVAGGVSARAGRVIFDHTPQGANNCRCGTPGIAPPRAEAGPQGRRLCRFNDVDSPLCSPHGCSVGYSSESGEMIFGRGSDVSFQPRFFVRSPAGIIKNGTCVYQGDRFVLAASGDPAQTAECGLYGPGPKHSIRDASLPIVLARATLTTAQVPGGDVQRPGLGVCAWRRRPNNVLLAASSL